MRRASAAALLAACVLARVADLPRVEGGRGGRLEDVDDDGDLTSFGWRRHHPRSHPELLGRPCTLDRADASSLTPAAFATRYQRPNRPVVLTGLASRNAEFRAMCHRDALLERWGDAAIVLSTANTHSYDKHVKTLREYAEHHMAPQTLDARGDETLYWFGDNDHGEWAPHFERYKAPPHVPATADVALSFGVGGPLSGVPLHVHGPGFSEMIVGRKHWWLAPHAPKPRFDPNATALEWALGWIEAEAARAAEAGREEAGASNDEDPKKRRDDDANAPRADDAPGFFECTVGEGEAVYFPDGWWHATLNLDESVFMSSFVNYARDERARDGDATLELDDLKLELDDLFEL